MANEIIAILLFVAGLGMYFVLTHLFGWYGVIIGLPLAYGIGWATGHLVNLEKK